jgi:hypothetical protein
MSLSAVPNDNIYVSVPQKPNYIKVIYNRLYDKKEISDASIPNNRNNIDKEIYDTLSGESNPNSIFNENMPNFYTTPYNVSQYKYIFIGKCSPEVIKYLAIIESNVDKSIKDPYTSVDLEFLAKELKYNKPDDMKDDLKLDGFYRVVFVQSFISTINTLNQIYKLASIYITNNAHDDIITTESIYMYGDLEDAHIDRQYQLVINNILYSYKSVDSKYTLDTLKSVLESFLVPLNIIQLVFQKYTNISQIFNILENDIIKNYIKLYIRFTGIGYKYTTKSKFNYPIDSNVVYYLESSGEDGVYTSRIEQKNVSINDTFKFKVLGDIGVKNNCFYFYNYYDIEKVLIHHKKLDEGVKLAIYDTIILKLFPNISLDNVLQSPVIMSDILSKRTRETATLDTYSRLVQDYSQYTISKTNPFTLHFNKQYIISIRKKINIPNNFDFRHVFNKVSLNHDIPFVKFRDVNGTNDIIYKVFKDITSKESINHMPLVTKDTLDGWVKHKGYEFENLTLKNLRNYPKNISFKYKFMTSKKTTLLHGMIYISHGNQHYDIITNTNKIYVNIPKVNITQQSSVDFKVDDTVTFFENDIIYADIDVYKKKFLEFTLDIRNIPTMTSTLLEQITSKINDFLTIFFQNDMLDRYVSINPDLSINDLTTKVDDTYIHSLIYQYRLDIPKKFEISYTLLEQAANLLFPFVLVNESIFNEGDIIQYYHTTKDRWVNGAVVAINVDGTYTLRLNDMSKGSVSVETIQHAKKISIKPATPDSLKIFNMIYKQVSDFNETSPIAYIVKKLSSTGLVSGLQIQKLMSMFVIDHEKASELLLRSNDDVTNLDSSTGVEINIDYTRRMYNSSYNDIHIYVSNIKSIQQIKDVYLFLNLFVELCLLIQDSTEIRPDLAHILATDSQPDPDTIKELDSSMNTMPSGITVSSKPQFTALSDGEDSDIEDSDDDDDMDYYGDVSGTEPPLDAIVQNTATMELHKDYVAESGIDLQLQKGLSWSTQLNLLKAADKELFDWGFSKKTAEKIQQQSWARTCQGNRQPRVLSNFDKVRVDTEFADRSAKWANSDGITSAYAEDLVRSNKKDTGLVMPKYIDCDETTMGELKLNTKDEPVMCKSLKWGASNDSSLHNWYICPKIFELNTQTPLHINDLKWGLSGDDVDDGEKITHTFIGGTKQSEANSWRTYHGPESIPVEKRDILHFDPYYEVVQEDGIVRRYFPTTMKNSRQRPASIKFSLELVDSSSARFIPGLMTGKHPLGYAMPCCYQSPSNVLKYLDPSSGNKGVSGVKSNYIQSWGHGLDENKYGLLPGILAGYFINKTPGQHPVSVEYTETGLCKTGQLKDNPGCFVRNGTTGDYNNFLAIIAKINGYRSGIGTDVVGDLTKNIIANLTESVFRNLNKGDLYNTFKYNGIQNPLQNFIEYLVSTQHKKMEFLYELLTSKKYNIVKHDYFFIMFDYNNVDNTLSLICPSFCDTVFKESMTIVFLIKTHGGLFEPLGKIIPTHEEPIYKFTIDRSAAGSVNYVDLAQYSNLVKIFDILRKKTCSSITIKPNYITLSEMIDSIRKTPDIGNISHLIKDDYNKIMGIYLDNGVTIPVHPQHYNGVDNISIMMSKDVQPVSISRLTDGFDKLNRTLTNTEISIQKINKSTDHTGIILTNIGTYIRVTDMTDTTDLLETLNNDYFRIDDTIQLYNDDYIKNIYKPVLRISEVKVIMDKDEIKDKYSIITILINTATNDARALLVTHDLVIPIYPTDVEDVKREIGEITTVPIDTYTINKPIPNYMNDISSFSRLTGGVLACVPIRGIFEEPIDTKKYGTVILESGLQIKIAPLFKFGPLDTNEVTGKLIINELIDTPIIHNIFNNSYDTINKELLSERIKTNIRINYNTVTLAATRETLFKLLQDDKLSDIREYILSIIRNRGIIASHKKIYIRPLILLFYKAIFKITSEEDLVTDLNDNLMCYLTNCKNASCDLSEPLNMFDFTRGDDSDIIRIGLCPFGNLIDTVAQNDVGQFIENSDIEIRNKLVLHFKKLLAYLEQKGNLCKIKVVDNEDHVNMLNMIFNELLFNKYKSDLLFNYHNKYISGDKLELNESTEVIFMNSDYTTDQLNKLYLYEQNKYYNTILPFNNSLSQPIHIRLQTNKQSCILETEAKLYSLMAIEVATEDPVLLSMETVDNILMHVILEDEGVRKLKEKLQGLSNL